LDGALLQLDPKVDQLRDPLLEVFLDSQGKRCRIPEGDEVAQELRGMSPRYDNRARSMER
jgi:hypothetical protein